MRIATFFLIFLGAAQGSNLRSANDIASSQRRLAIHYNNNFYWTLNAMMIYYNGGCKIKTNSAVCSMPGSVSTLTGKGSGKNVSAQELEVCTEGAGSKHCSTYYFDGSMTPGQIRIAAYPDQMSGATADYRKALYAMLYYYSGPGCSLSVKGSTFTTTCSMPGSTATLIGTGQGPRNSPNPQSLEKCTLGGSSKSCQTVYFNQGNADTTIAQVFPDTQ